MAHPHPHPQPSSLHPIIRPAEEYEVVKPVVRDEHALGPTEDLDRQPDGVPHRVVGLTALFSVMLAILVGALFITGGTFSRVAAVALAVFAVPVLVSTLRRRADEGRDRIHPSR